MFLLRVAFWVAIVAFLLPPTISAGSYQGSAPASVEAETGFDPSRADDLVMSTVQKISTLCEDHPRVCEFRDTAVHVLHVQAVYATGALHNWLKARLKEREDI